MPETTTEPVTQQNITTPPQDNLDATQAADSFSALNKLFDEVPPTAAVVPQVTNPTEPPASERTPVGTEPPDAFEQSLEAIKPPQDAHPNQVKGIEELRRISRDEHKAKTELEQRAKDLEAKIADYEQKLKSPELPEPTKKELEELRAMRREVDLRLDPEFQKEYIQPVQQADTEIMSILKQAGMKDDIAEWIQKNGGLINMAQSNAPADDKQTLAEWVDKSLLARTPTMFRNRVISKLNEALELTDKGKRTLADHQQNSKSRWEDRMKKVTADFEEGANKARTTIGDLAARKSIPPDATPEQKLEIDKHNSRVTEGEKRFQEYLQTSKDPHIAGELIVKAVQADALLDWNKDLQTQVQELTDKLTKIKAAGSTSRAGSHAPPPGPTEPNRGDLLKQTDATALGGLLDKIGVKR